MNMKNGGSALLRVESISKTFRNETEFKALDNVSLYVMPGECVGLIGSSGSGKSTLANVIAGFVEPDSGVVEFDGTRIEGVSNSRHKRGVKKKSVHFGMQMVFQNPEASFLSTMRLGDAVYEGLRYLPNANKANKDMVVKKAFDAVGLPSSYMDRFPFELSGGECQRAAIARAIIGEPKLIICDEPTSSLDVTVQSDVMDLLDNIHSEFNTAFLFISHNIALVSGFCSRIYKMNEGRIIEQLEKEC